MATATDPEMEDFDDLDDGDGPEFEGADEDGFILATQFANPGSALRAAGPNNPRNRPCGTCGEPDRLTPADVALGYQCDECADRAEGGGF